MSKAAITKPAAPQHVPGWASLVKAVERLSAADRLADIIEVVRTTARDISGADGVCFVLRDGELCHYIEEDAIGPLWKGKRFALTACISGWCMFDDQPAVIPDIYADPRIPHDAYRPTFVKSLVMVPVGAPTRIAAIGSYWAIPRPFDEDEIHLLEALARSTSSAIAAAQLRETLRDREQRLSMALDAGGLGAWELDLVTGTLIATPACKAIFGREPGDAFTYEELMRTIELSRRTEAHAVFEAAKGPRSGIDFECRIVWPDKSEHDIEMRGRVILDANRTPARTTGVVRDVTGRRRARERLDRLHSDLAHAGRLNEMGQMVSALAHELNQPLAAAVNYMGVAERYLLKDPIPLQQTREVMAKAEAQFVRANEIIKRIRGFAGKGKIAKTLEDVGETIAEALALARIDPKHHGVELRVEVDEDLPPVLIDKVQIQQVLLNLLRNAFEAMEGAAHREVTVSAHLGKDKDAIDLCVADTGPGIAAEIAERLFEPFRTTKEYGMGVGLSLCHTIVEAHDGKMWSAPEEGKGAIFCFTLPLTG